MIKLIKSFRKDKLKKLILNFSLVILVVYFSCVLGEVLLRALYPQDLPNTKPDIYEYDAFLGWTYKKNSAFKTLSPDASELVDLDFNSDGFRQNEYLADKKKILLIGDSTTGAVQVNVSDHFATIINERFPEYQVINTGVNGYAADQAYLSMTKLMSELDIHLVIYLFNPNDIPGNLFKSINIGIHRYGKPFFKVENEALLLESNSATKREFRDKILIDRELLYELEFTGYEDLVKVLEESAIYGKSYQDATELKKVANEVFGEETDKIIVSAIMSRAMNPPTVRKVLRREKELKNLNDPSLFSLFVSRKKLNKIFSGDHTKFQKIDSDNLYRDISLCPLSYKLQRTKTIEKAWNLQELLLDSMHVMAKKNNAHFLIVPHLDYIAEYDYKKYKQVINKLNDCQAEKLHNDIELSAKKFNIPIALEVLELAKADHSDKEHYNFKNNRGQTINGHYSKKGHKVTAEGIIKHIVTNKLLQ